jgi:hypothetical protein
VGEVNFEDVPIEELKESGVSTRAYNALAANFKLAEVVKLSDENTLHNVPNVSMAAAKIIKNWIDLKRAVQTGSIDGVIIEEGEHEIRRVVTARTYKVPMTRDELIIALRPYIEKKIGRTLKDAELSFNVADNGLNFEFVARFEIIS